MHQKAQMCTQANQRSLPICKAWASLNVAVVCMQVVPEPVDKWQDIGNGHHNVLQAFYDTPDRYAYTFQNYVFVTRMMQVCFLCCCWHSLRL